MICQSEIPLARRNALPGVRTCIEHSTETPVKGFMTWEHKTAPTINVTSSERVFADYRKYTRKGVHAQLPMSSKGGAAMANYANKMLRNEGEELRRIIHEEPEPEVQVHNVVMARCHPDRPKASSDGKCLECVQAWYKNRHRGR